MKGGKIHGRYPDDLSPTTGILNNGRGLILPTTSWDSVWHGIIQWLGLTESTDINYCLPNAVNTKSPVAGAGDFSLLTGDDLFHT